MCTHRLDLEAVTAENLREAFTLLSRREKELGVTFLDGRYSRWHNGLRLGRAILLRDSSTKDLVGLAVGPAYQEAFREGRAQIELPDLGGVPAHIGALCVIMPAVLVDAALYISMHAPFDYLELYCPAGLPVHELLVRSFGAMPQPDNRHWLRLDAAAICSLAQELHKHIGRTMTTSHGRNGRVEFDLSRSGMLFSGAREKCIDALRLGDLSPLGHDRHLLDQRRVAGVARACIA